MDYSKKVQYFIRDVKSINSQNATAAKTKKVPKILKNEVEFVQGNKRKQMADSAVSIEKRLENLLMKPTDPKELPCMNKLVQLLNQALRNGDHDMLKMLITSTTNQVTIRNTVSTRIARLTFLRNLHNLFNRFRTCRTMALCYFWNK